jgi:predicted XRE-type DNA-binding protein
MTNDIEIERGTNNIFCDVGHPDAETLQLKAQLAGKIITVLSKRKLKGKMAADTLSMTEADISRIRNADLARFTLDRLVEVLNRLSMHVEIKITKTRSHQIKESSKQA